MRVLVDTQSWLWIVSVPERLSASTRQLVEATETELFLSSASALEIAIKYALGKLSLPDPPAKYLPRGLQDTQTVPLAISHEHALRSGELPPHHRDPFDRILIAQAQLERLPLLTADRPLAAYDVELIWAT